MSCRTSRRQILNVFISRRRVWKTKASPVRVRREAYTFNNSHSAQLRYSRVRNASESPTARVDRTLLNVTRSVRNCRQRVDECPCPVSEFGSQNAAESIAAVYARRTKLFENKVGGDSTRGSGEHEPCLTRSRAAARVMKRRDLTRSERNTRRRRRFPSEID